LQKALSDDIYLPSEDTFFFAEHIKNEQGQMALEIGTGSGYLAEILSSKFSIVICTDINFNSMVRVSDKNSFNYICCDGADAIHCKFDFIICNMPYLPSDSIRDIATDGGKDGVEIPIHIIKSAKRCMKANTRFLFLTSTIANYEKLIEKTRMLGFDVQIISRKKLFFEELVLVQAILK